MNKIKMCRFLIFSLTIWCVSGYYGCKKFVEVSPPITELISSDIFSSDGTATAAMMGIYSNLISNNNFAGGGSQGIAYLTGLSSDELENYSTTADQIQFYRNQLTKTNNILGASLWGASYQTIYQVNSVLEGISSSKSISPKVKNQLSGEAYFLRAFCYFYLVNLFGNPPLLLTTDQVANSRAGNTPEPETYQQIIADLKLAESLLNTNYVEADDTTVSQTRVRPNKAAAAALLAKTYLFAGDWADAETEASSVIDNTSAYSLTANVNDVFLANSTEAIWQLLPVLPGINTTEGYTFILNSAPNNCAISQPLLDAFEPGDLRRSVWVDSITFSGKTYYYPAKYKVKESSTITEYSMVLRLAEVYIIRSEARANLGHIEEAKEDLNLLRARAGLPNTNAIDQASLIAAIQHERQVEMFTEWGNRWLDLNRTNTIDAVMTTVAALKGSTWSATQKLYPIPFSEIQADPNLKQNPGY
jgi:hypothetical protein